MIQIGRSLVRSQMVSLEFFIDIKSFRSHYGPGVDSASNRNEYQEYFLGVKSGRCVRLTNVPPSCAVVMKSGNLNFLEPSGPLQACKGTVLPYFTSYWIISSLFTIIEFFISGFRLRANEVFTLLSYYAALINSCRSFGTSERSYHQGSSGPRRQLFGPLCPWWLGR